MLLKKVVGKFPRVKSGKTNRILRRFYDDDDYFVDEEWLTKKEFEEELATLVSKIDKNNTIKAGEEEFTVLWEAPQSQITTFYFKKYFPNILVFSSLLLTLLITKGRNQDKEPDDSNTDGSNDIIQINDNLDGLSEITKQKILQMRREKEEREARSYNLLKSDANQLPSDEAVEEFIEHILTADLNEVVSNGEQDEIYMKNIQKRSLFYPFLGLSGFVFLYTFIDYRLTSRRVFKKLALNLENYALYSQRSGAFYAKERVFGGLDKNEITDFRSNSLHFGRFYFKQRKDDREDMLDRTQVLVLLNKYRVYWEKRK